MSDVFLRYNQEVIVANRSLGQGEIEVFALTPENKVLINTWVFETEPTVLVFLDFDSLHLEVDLERSTFESDLLVLINELFSDADVFEPDEAVRL